MNLVSGRRRVLSNHEALLIESMICKNKNSDFTAEENSLCNRLIHEKQFIDANERKIIEI